MVGNITKNEIKAKKTLLGKGQEYFILLLLLLFIVVVVVVAFLVSPSQTNS